MARMGKYTSIGIICECGIGSSAMGAALLKKVLNENGIEYISVKTYAAGMADSGTGLFICERDYYSHIKDQLEGMEVYQVESLLSKKEYQALVVQLMKQEKT